MEGKKLIGLREVAGQLALSPWTLYGMMEKTLNGIPRYKIGRQWRFNLDEVDRWYMRQREYEVYLYTLRY